MSIDIQNQIALIKAQEHHIKIVYQWQSDSRTRNFSLNQVSPSYHEHAAWMHQKLYHSPKDYFYLCEYKSNQQVVGVVRLDYLKESEYLLSIFVAPDHYGKGIALAALKQVDEVHPDITIFATVLPANIASQNLFEKAEYYRAADNRFIRYPISL